MWRAAGHLLACLIEVNLHAQLIPFISSPASTIASFGRPCQLIIGILRPSFHLLLIIIMPPCDPKEGEN